MQSPSSFYVESPTIPAGMTCGEWRRNRGQRRRPVRRLLAARLKRAAAR